MPEIEFSLEKSNPRKHHKKDEKLEMKDKVESAKTIVNQELEEFEHYRKDFIRKVSQLLIFEGIVGAMSEDLESAQDFIEAVLKGNLAEVSPEARVTRAAILAKIISERVDK